MSIPKTTSPPARWPRRSGRMWSRFSRPLCSGVTATESSCACEVDLKLAASISGNKSCAMVHVRELLGLTGYIRGGCSPIGMKKRYPTFIHESALLYDYIYISAGVRGLQFKISPTDLFRFTAAEIYPI